MPPLDLYFNKRLADFENRLQQPSLDDRRGGKKIPGSIVYGACSKIYWRFALQKRRGRRRAPGPQGPTAVEKAAATIAEWIEGSTDTDNALERAWRVR